MTTLTFPRPMGVQLAEYERNGCRPLVNDEADALRYRDEVTVLDTLTGDFLTGKIISVTRDGLRVQFPRGAIFTFDADNPDFWPEGEQRMRKPPICVEDGREFVIVTAHPYPKPTPMFNALKASVELLALRKQVKALTDDLQGRPTRDEHEALLNDVHELHQLVRMLVGAKVA